MLTLQQYLESRGIGSRRFAELIGVNPSTAHQIAKGRRVPSIGTLQKIRAMAPDQELYLSVSHYASQSCVAARRADAGRRADQTP